MNQDGHSNLLDMQIGRGPEGLLGDIPKENLLSICNEVELEVDVIIHAIKMVLGHEFLVNENRYHVNTNLTSHFLASLLYLGEKSVQIFFLLRRVFKPKYLDDDINIVAHIEIGGGDPLG